ncbi:MAG: glycosyltransferase family 2 protein [Bacteroidales bacterium]|nr:glycosyltransferase family 2 protein [Bacteroidales bacterium]
MEHTPAISIIVPVYKVEQYLRRCLDSIQNQTFTDWECILIDDGSPDNSGSICDEYAQKDKRFRVIHQENKGVSAARNAGLNVARGEWISFVDSDDYLYPDALKDLFGAIQPECLVVSGIQFSDGQKKQTYTSHTADVNEYVSKLFQDSDLGYLGYLFPKLYDASIIKEKNIRFDEAISYNEDRLFVLQYVLNCKNVIFSNGIAYNYNQRNDSAMGIVRNSYNPRMITELIAFEKMLEILLVRDRKNSFWCSRCAYFASGYLIHKATNKLDIKAINDYKKQFYNHAIHSGKCFEFFIPKLKLMIRRCIF